MKKTTISIIIGVLLIILAPTTHASTADDLRAQIANLLNLITVLQQKLDKVENEPQTTPIYTPTTIVQDTCPNITRNLWRGLRGQDVLGLQQYLRSTGDYTYPEITGYYGGATEGAVQRWQARNGVVSYGTPDSTGFGVLGPRTRSIFKKACDRLIQPTVPTQCPTVTAPNDKYCKLENGITGIWKYSYPAGAVYPACASWTCVVDKNIATSCPIYQRPLCDGVNQHVEIEQTGSNGCVGAPKCVDNEISGTPQISVLLSSLSFKLGSSIKLTLDKKNIPTNAGLVLEVVGDDSAGPLMLSPRTISGSGSETFHWVSKKTGCAPLDSPTWCENIKTGKYRIEATVYNRSDFDILGDVPTDVPGPNSEKKVIAEYKTEPFYLTW